MRRTGHIRERSPGSFELRYSLRTDPATGKRRVATTTVRGSRKDAEKELRRLLHLLDTNEHVDPTRITVRQWLTTWLETIREEVAARTHERYAEIVNNFLVPALGNLPIVKLAPHIFRMFTPLGLQGAAAIKRQGASLHKPADTFTGYSALLSPAPLTNRSSLAIRAVRSRRNGSPRWSAEKWLPLRRKRLALSWMQFGIARFTGRR